jgi:tetratricopeptide (TPR) repeat protein
MRPEATVAIVAVAAIVAAGAAAAPARAAAPAENAAAKAAFVEGERNFQLGKFDVAIEAYERAFGLDPQPAFLFNIALAHRRQYEIDGKLDHLARARELYRNYLKLEPRSPSRAGVENLIVELTEKLEQARRRPEAPAAAAPASPPAPRAVELTAAAAAPPAPPPAPAPASTPAAVLSSPAGEAAAPRPSNRKWVIGATIAGVAAVAAIAIVLITRGGSSFDGPGVDVTPDMPP